MSRPRPSFADYVVIAISPALIMLLVGSLVFFLIEVFYHGDYDGRLSYIMALFVFAAVLIARIAIENGREYALLYSLGLGGAVVVAINRFVQFSGPLRSFSFPINLGLIALVWWCADKLTWDSTVIDESKDASGQGLLQTVGLDKDLEATSGRNELIAARPTQTLWQRFVAYRRRDHAPGVWVVYFSIAALPIFGFGNWFVPSGDLEARRYVFKLLVVYVASALGLLLTTSFLGLRRYLRQRQLEMPAEMAGAWMSIGAAMIVSLLAVCMLLPRRNSEYSVTQLPMFAGSPTDLWTTDHAVGNEGQEDPAKADRVGDKPMSEPSQSDQSGDNAQPGGETPSDSQKQGEQDSSSQSSKGQPSSESSSSDPSAAQKSNSPSPGEQQNSEGQPSHPDSSPSNDKQSSAEKNTVNQPDRSESKKSEQPQNKDGKKSPAKEKTDKSDSPGEPGSDPRQKQDSKSKKENQDPSDQQQQQQPKSQKQKRDQSQRKQADSEKSAGQPQEPKQSFDPSKLPSAVGGMLGNLFKLLYWVVIVGAVAFFLWKYWRQVREAIANFLKALRDFWDSLWGRKRIDPVAEAEAAAAVAPPPIPFSAFHDPFVTGMAQSKPPAEVIRYSFEAFEAWAREHGCERGPEHTPHEFAQIVGQRESGLARDAAALAELYNRCAYAKDGGRVSVEPLRRLWQLLGA